LAQRRRPQHWRADQKRGCCCLRRPCARHFRDPHWRCCRCHQKTTTEGVVHILARGAHTRGRRREWQRGREQSQQTRCSSQREQHTRCGSSTGGQESQSGEVAIRHAATMRAARMRSCLPPPARPLIPSPARSQRLLREVGGATEVRQRTVPLPERDQRVSRVEHRANVGQRVLAVLTAEGAVPDGPRRALELRCSEVVIRTAA
jgi:hypothetical protein